MGRGGAVGPDGSDGGCGSAPPCAVLRCPCAAEARARRRGTKRASPRAGRAGTALRAAADLPDACKVARGAPGLRCRRSAACGTGEGRAGPGRGRPPSSGLKNERPKANSVRFASRGRRARRWAGSSGGGVGPGRGASGSAELGRPAAVSRGRGGNGDEDRAARFPAVTEPEPGAVGRGCCRWELGGLHWGGRARLQRDCVFFIKK